MFLLEITDPITTKHRVSVTVVDQGATAVTQRNTLIQKIIRVVADSEEEAVSRAMAHYKKQGYRVKEANYIGTVTA
jgi:hypothetical protein